MTDISEMDKLVLNPIKKIEDKDIDLDPIMNSRDENECLIRGILTLESTEVNAQSKEEELNQEDLEKNYVYNECAKIVRNIADNAATQVASTPLIIGSDASEFVSKTISEMTRNVVQMSVDNQEMLKNRSFASMTSDMVCTSEGDIDLEPEIACERETFKEKSATMTKSTQSTQPNNWKISLAKLFRLKKKSEMMGSPGSELFTTIPLSDESASSSQSKTKSLGKLFRRPRGILFPGQGGSLERGMHNIEPANDRGLGIGALINRLRRKNSTETGDTSLVPGEQHCSSIVKDGDEPIGHTQIKTPRGLYDPKNPTQVDAPAIN